MGWMTSFSVYFIIWWVVLFIILPLGIRSHAEAGTIPIPGADPGAPVNPNIKRKFITTTWVSALIFAPLWIAIHFHWLTYESLGGPR